MDESVKLFINEVKLEFDQINPNRKKELSFLAELIHEELKKMSCCKVMFICTHNSRRSQLAEFLLRIVAHDKGINGLETFSGGTEATSFNYRMVNALDSFSFNFDQTNDISNPKYSFLSNHKELNQVMFSKVYDDSSNPQSNYIAVMVCDHADQNCPIVSGASHRISLPYVDPKNSDDTPQEVDAYVNKIEEMGREMLYLCEEIRGLI